MNGSEEVCLLQGEVYVSLTCLFREPTLETAMPAPLPSPEGRWGPYLPARARRLLELILAT